MDYKDIAIRSLKTFGQVFVGTLIVTDSPTSKAAIFSAFIAGVTAVWNIVLVPAFKWFKQSV